MIDTVLISASSRASETIFGRPLLERLILMCERAGMKRFFIERPQGRGEQLRDALGSFRTSPNIELVDSLNQVLEQPFGMAREQPCLALSGNMVFARSQLNQMLAMQAEQPSRVIRVPSAGGDGTAVFATGPLGDLLSEIATRTRNGTSSGYLPYVLDGRPEDGREAELRLARSVRLETTDSDGLLARLFDRKISWRISYRLAYTPITPNQVTLFNTGLGLLSAWMFSVPGYWIRLLGSLVFLLIVTIDGVDGELARLRMTESEWGGKLDVITDNIVHIVLFIGLMIGCYRASGSAAYFYLLPLLLGGFVLSAISVNRAFKAGAAGEEWIKQVDRIAGRDFAYLLVVLAAINQLEFFAWGTAFGTYVFAFGMWWFTNRHARNAATASRSS